MKNVLNTFENLNLVRILKVFFLIIVLVALQTAVFGQDSTPGLEYSLINDGNEYTVKSGSATSGAIMIPATHNNRPVREISPGAFKNTTITSVTIGNNVTKIHNDAFNECTQLRRVTLSNSLISIGERAFENSGITSLTIPDSVEIIGLRAFFGCKNLTTVTIGRRLTNILLSTFENCTDLTTVTIGSSVNTIGPRAFFDCKNLTNVTIGNLVASIGQNAFSNNLSLARITLPSNVTSIQGAAFSGCRNLVNVTIQGTITSGNFSRTAFPGDLRDKYFIKDERSGGRGTYTRSDGSSNTWLKR